ncbi:Cys-tRNA(Pro) deacylase [Paenibacillus polygoni]|uniref:Cys-tRNA(Pro)/Cys-tRNA(Cys) deacylase n=1 Tax=Paenibacillus polygoni TaxID=3050112 RepID=A0ABY8WX81_9BACL|nr:Cys-tRNA(Pro) deacylase [Paenibacillus polygoni]WIV17617.1 Cys-tRNA(Pro) deacylase [Paenibacillus polygoni]
MKQEKTNAMRMLDKQKVSYDMLTYSVDDGDIDGLSVARKVGRSPELVYKTLVAQGSNTKGYFVFVIPVQCELDLKKAAKGAKEKKIELIAVKDLLEVTGYIRGGCSPIGMKKRYPVFIDEQAKDLDKMIISAGKVGFQLEIETNQLVKVTDATLAPLCK